MDVPSRPLSLAAFQQLAEFRFCVRQFLHFSEQAARAHGLEPQQHQLLLAVKGLPGSARPNITELSSRLCLRHHSTVELINRLVERGVIMRRSSDQDRREVLIELTLQGEQVLEKLSQLHWEELQTAGPTLVKALDAILHAKEGASA